MKFIGIGPCTETAGVVMVFRHRGSDHVMLITAGEARELGCALVAFADGSKNTMLIASQIDKRKPKKKK